MKTQLLAHSFDIKPGETIYMTVHDWGNVYHYQFNGFCTYSGYRSHFVHKSEASGKLLVYGLKVAHMLNNELHKMNRANRYNLSYLKEYAEKAKGYKKATKNLEAIVIELIHINIII